MVYTGEPPTFADGFFSYEVAGMHYLPDGSLALGTYDLVIADSVARCLYGFSNAPISATVSVAENDGSENVATKTASDSNGCLHVAAYGFTFSNPVIKVELTQKGFHLKIATIACVRGWAIKKVRGFRPTCPTGFHRKN
jgi:hypothetical protein